VPLGPLDDYLVHQTLDTLDRAESDDPRWMERFWFGVCDPAGEIGLICGLGIYPNSGMVDGLALVARPGAQHNLRTWRPLADSRWTLDSAPLSFEIADPMSTWRLRAEPSDLDFSFDLTFTARTQPFQMEPSLLIRKDDGRLVIAYAHFVQSGRFDGGISVGGRRWAVDGWLGERDRSWGARNPSGLVKKGLHIWLPLQLPDVAPWVWIHERPNGLRTGQSGALRPDGMGEPDRIRDFTYDLDVREVGRHRILDRSRIALASEAGRALELETELLLPVFLSGGGYADDATAQGARKAAAGYEGEVWPTATDADLAAIPISIIDHFVRVGGPGGTGVGVFELSVGEFEPMGYAS
jgi:hypothetical protein